MFNYVACMLNSSNVHLDTLLFSRNLTSRSFIGLINAIAFGINKETLSRLNWADMKVQ